MPPYVARRGWRTDSRVHGLAAGGAAHSGVPELAPGGDLGSDRGWPGVALNEIDDVYERQVPARGEPSRAMPGPGPAVLDATTPAAKPVARVS
jgi:hypothetical protein